MAPDELDDRTFALAEHLADMLGNMGLSSLQVDGETLVHARRQERTIEPPLVGYGDPVKVGDVVRLEYHHHGTWIVEREAGILRTHVENGTFMSGPSLIHADGEHYQTSFFSLGGAFGRRRFRLLQAGPGDEHATDFDPATDAGVAHLDARFRSAGHPRTPGTIDRPVVATGNGVKHAALEGTSSAACGAKVPAATGEAYTYEGEGTCKRCNAALTKLARENGTAVDPTARTLRARLAQRRQ